MITVQKKGYRDTFSMIYDILDICHDEEINKSKVGLKTKLGHDITTVFIERLLILGYLECFDSGLERGGGKIFYYKTTQKGFEFKNAIEDWVLLQKKMNNL